MFLCRYKKCGSPVVLVCIGLYVSLLPFWLSMLYNFLKSRLHDKFSFWSKIYREKLDKHFSRRQKTETLWPSIFVSSMYIVCVHNTASIRVFSAFLFVCLVGPFCRIKHVTYVNVNILCCMRIYVWRFVVMTSRCLCILMCKWLLSCNVHVCPVWQFCLFHSCIRVDIINMIVLYKPVIHLHGRVLVIVCRLFAFNWCFLLYMYMSLSS